MAKQFLDLAGLSTFFTQLKNIFATPDDVAAVTDAVAAVTDATDDYILNIDYESTLAFDTKEIITDEEDA